MPQPLVSENVKHIVDKENKQIHGVFHEEVLYVETKISQSHLVSLKKKAKICLENQNRLNKANSNLAGNIEKEFYLDKTFEDILSQYSTSLADKFIKISNQNKPDKINIESLEWIAVKPWINFQKKFEFNPTHHHYGDYSFVLWIEIPYDLKEEFKLDNCVNSNTKRNSVFTFSYLSTSGEILERILPIDKAWEGTMILFPSNLRHNVYPFYTSDDYRISISGNLIRKLSSKKTFSYQ